MESPKQSLRDLILSEESAERINKAIVGASARADAAGLPPAYEPAFSKLATFRNEQKQYREELLRLRRNARAAKAEQDAVTLEFHRKVFDLLESGGQPADFIMRKAKEMISMWEKKGLNSMYGPMWKSLLDGSPNAARDFILSDNTNGWPLGLRSSSPFPHIAIYRDDEWPEGKNLLKS